MPSVLIFIVVHSTLQTWEDYAWRNGLAKYYILFIRKPNGVFSISCFVIFFFKCPDVKKRKKWLCVFVYIKYGKLWSIWPGHCIKHKPLNFWIVINIHSIQIFSWLPMRLPEELSPTFSILGIQFFGTKLQFLD